ncbi:unnamed protein product, partial [Mycena citricolor]
LKAQRSLETKSIELLPEKRKRTIVPPSGYHTAEFRGEQLDALTQYMLFRPGSAFRSLRSTIRLLVHLLHTHTVIDRLEVPLGRLRGDRVQLDCRGLRDR